jgi:MFS family permease
VSEVGIFTILNVIASGFTSYFVGILGDKRGHKSGMMVAYIAHFTAVLLAIFSQNMLWVYAVFMAIGAGQGAFMPSAMNLVYDFAEERDTKTYMALVDTLLAPFVLIFIVGIGYLIRFGDYTLSLYMIGASLFLGMVILHFVVRDPKKPTEHAFNVDGFSS